MHPVVSVAAALYTANLAVGVLAQLASLRFGHAHHVLFFIVVLATVGAAFVAFDPWLMLPLGCLLLLPKARGGSIRHAVLAGLGGVGYVAAMLR